MLKVSGLLIEKKGNGFTVTRRKSVQNVTAVILVIWDRQSGAAIPHESFA